MATRKLGGRGSTSDAEDLAHDAIAHVVEHVDAWDPNDKELALQLGSALNGIASNRRRKRALVREKLGASDDHAADSSRAPADPRHGEGVYARRELAAKTMAKVEARLEGDELAVRVLRDLALGASHPKEQVAKFGKDMTEIVAARRRVEYHVRLVVAELQRSAA